MYLIVVTSKTPILEAFHGSAILFFGTKPEATVDLIPKLSEAIFNILRDEFEVCLFYTLSLIHI